MSGDDRYPCGDRERSQCPGEWEPGCDLGNNPDHVAVSTVTGAEVDAALATPSADRWVPVPVEATQTMTEAGSESINANGGHARWADIREAWAAMLAAAPAAPAAEPDKAAWWALVMGAAASIEDAANCLRDPDAKRQAEGAMAHYRAAAQKLYAAPGATPAPAQSREPLTMLTDEQLLQILGDLDADTKRLPPGIKAFARAVIAEFCKINGIGSQP